MTARRDPFDDQALDLGDMPLCPVCPAGRPYNVESRGHLGLECLNCGTVFRGTPGEMTHPRNRKRQRIVAEYDPEPPPPPEGPGQALAKRVLAIGSAAQRHDDTKEG